MTRGRKSCQQRVTSVSRSRDICGTHDHACVMPVITHAPLSLSPLPSFFFSLKTSAVLSLPLQDIREGEKRDWNAWRKKKSGWVKGKKRRSDLGTGNIATSCNMRGWWWLVGLAAWWRMSFKNSRNGRKNFFLIFCTIWPPLSLSLPPPLPLSHHACSPFLLSLFLLRTYVERGRGKEPFICSGEAYLSGGGEEKKWEEGRRRRRREEESHHRSQHEGIKDDVWGGGGGCGGCGGCGCCGGDGGCGCGGNCFFFSCRLQGVAQTDRPTMRLRDHRNFALLFFKQKRISGFKSKFEFFYL